MSQIFRSYYFWVSLFFLFNGRFIFSDAPFRSAWLWSASALAVGVLFLALAINDALEKRPNKTIK